MHPFGHHSLAPQKLYDFKEKYQPQTVCVGAVLMLEPFYLFSLSLSATTLHTKVMNAAVLSKRDSYRLNFFYLLISRTTLENPTAEIAQLPPTPKDASAIAGSFFLLYKKRSADWVTKRLYICRSCEQQSSKPPSTMAFL